MNYIDIVLGLLLLAGLIHGFMKGFIYEVAVVGALFLGVLAAFKLSHLVSPHIAKIVSNEQAVMIVSSFIMFLLVFIGIIFLAKLFSGLANMAALGVFNKILGAAFGMVKYAFIVSILLHFFNSLDSKYTIVNQKTKSESFLFSPITGFAPSLLPVIKEEIAAVKTEAVSVIKTK